MGKLKDKRLIIIIGIIAIVLTIVALILLLPKTSNDVAVKTHVKHNVVDKLYKEVENNKKEDTREYVSKLYGYTYDDNENIVMQVKEGYIENNKLYDLEGKELGDYNKYTINTLLDKGTSKTYNYTKDNGDYKLEK